MRSIAFYSLSCCGGCLQQVLRDPGHYLELSKSVQVARFRLIQDGPNEAESDVDIAVVEGSIGNDEENEKAIRIRQKSGIVIALGACATHGGIQQRGGFRPLASAIKIDGCIRGCPIDPKEFMRGIASILIGRDLRQKELSVCSQCRERENACLLENKRECVGFLAYAGCEAACVSRNTWCLACRGQTKDANLGAAKDLGVERLLGFFGEDHGRD